MGRDEKRAPLKTLAWEGNERVAAVRRFADFIFEDNERFLLFLVRLKTSNSAAELSASFVLDNEAQTSEKKYSAKVLY